MAHVRDQVRQIAVVVLIGWQCTCGVVEQRQAAHEPGEVNAIHAATTLERARLDEVRVQVDASRRDIGISAEVVLAVKHLQAL